MEITIVKPVLFYIFSSLAIATALMVIIFRNPLYSATSLVVTFFSIAVIFILLGSEFIAVMQVLVYAGAIMVLVIFVIMLLNLKNEAPIKNLLRSFFAILITGILFVSMMFVLVKGASENLEGAKRGVITEAVINETGSIEVFSMALFSEYLIPFELASLLLTAAIIGVVILAKGMRKKVSSTGEKGK